MKRVALIGSWDPKWIRQHEAWLDEHREHLDGWKNRINASDLELLRSALKSEGFFRFYAYLPKRKKDGSGKVEYEIRCDRLEYSKEPKVFRHEHGRHEDAARYPARVIFRIREINFLTAALDVRDFARTNGKRLRHPVELLGMPVVSLITRG